MGYLPRGPSRGPPRRCGRAPDGPPWPAWRSARPRACSGPWPEDVLELIAQFVGNRIERLRGDGGRISLGAGLRCRDIGFGLLRNGDFRLDLLALRDRGAVIRLQFEDLRVALHRLGEVLERLQDRAPFRPGVRVIGIDARCAVQDRGG